MGGHDLVAMRAAMPDTIRIKVGRHRIDNHFDADCVLPLTEFDTMAKIGTDPAFLSRRVSRKTQCSR